ncbi:hypothetical protein PR048_026093 [Dryococelus australis]|uniref:C2H2-type domain-containing protein n=1 Tax=Dryococelus australis TaxID=614101 RepID=A0ABQ9GKF4_9NEOP|nr:hypothetical protein PR048_026093 [Dryococelus australis]
MMRLWQAATLHVFAPLEPFEELCSLPNLPSQIHLTKFLLVWCVNCRCHVKIEPGTEHVCEECGEAFASSSELLSHSESHSRYQPHRCMLCGECFDDAAGVSSHIRRKHGKAIPSNTCTLCGKTCKDRRSLQKHSWVHSAERSFQCLKCNKRFHSRARLKRHMTSHRDKAVSCEVCGEEFPDGRALINHRHSHNKDVSARQFSCVECGKTFGSRSSQQIHARIHTGERPYGCRYCWKAFADGGTLRKHERIHTGEKPYACVVCPRAFNQRSTSSTTTDVSDTLPTLQAPPPPSPRAESQQAAQTSETPSATDEARSRNAHQRLNALQP